MCTTIAKTEKCGKCGEEITAYMAECLTGLCVDCHLNKIGRLEDEDERDEPTGPQCCQCGATGVQLCYPSQRCQDCEHEAEEEQREELRELVDTLDPEKVMAALRAAGLVK